MLHKKSIAASTEIIKCNLNQYKECRRVIISYPPKSHDAPISLSVLRVLEYASLSRCIYLFISAVKQYDILLLLLLLLLLLKGSMGDVEKEGRRNEQKGDGDVAMFDGCVLSICEGTFIQLCEV